MSDKDRVVDLESYLEDITKWVVIPSATSQHFSQICDIKDFAKEILTKRKGYSSIASQMAELNKKISRAEAERDFYKEKIDSIEKEIEKYGWVGSYDFGRILSN